MVGREYQSAELRPGSPVRRGPNPSVASRNPLYLSSDACVCTTPVTGTRLRTSARIMGSQSFRERVRKGERPKVAGTLVTLLPLLALSPSHSLRSLTGCLAARYTTNTLAPCVGRSHNTSESNPFTGSKHYVAKRSTAAKKGRKKQTRGNRLGSLPNPFHNACS